MSILGVCSLNKKQEKLRILGQVSKVVRLGMGGFVGGNEDFKGGHGRNLAQQYPT